MKIYLFDNETGCYQGEDFVDGPLDDSVPTSFTGATTIAPPPFGPGQVPIFQSLSAAWQICRITDLKRGGRNP
ncbi:hypothetical protein GMLC_31790 [Geomonas limicola]|uniref:Uncharacterized protein n=1 Tax=Geomonas limicola TaxID=2740186 RepID=A0A6V8NAX4_9BACT|nr:hypothetical protein [Geomonas limicola]GFO69600.1 hypothetical protein GMLC_31790 [Geomonas limicola]